MRDHQSIAHAPTVTRARPLSVRRARKKPPGRPAGRGTCRVSAKTRQVADVRALVGSAGFSSSYPAAAPKRLETTGRALRDVSSSRPSARAARAGPRRKKSSSSRVFLFGARAVRLADGSSPEERVRGAARAPNSLEYGFVDPLLTNGHLSLPLPHLSLPVAVRQKSDGCVRF